MERPNALNAMLLQGPKTRIHAKRTRIQRGSMTDPTRIHSGSIVKSTCMDHVSVTNPLPKLRLCTTSSPCGRCLQPHAHSLLSSLLAAEPVGAFWECFQIVESNPLLSESDRSEWYLRFANMYHLKLTPRRLLAEFPRPPTRLLGVPGWWPGTYAGRYAGRSSGRYPGSQLK